MAGPEYFDYLERLGDEASSILEVAVRVSDKHFASSDSDDPNVVVAIAQLMASVALRHSLDTVASELSSIENAINGK